VAVDHQECELRNIHHDRVAARGIEGGEFALVVNLGGGHA
jgi:hypothetical protein